MADGPALQVCAASLDQPPAVVETLRDLLSDDERARAARFRFDPDRRRFTVARGFLRQMVGTIVSAPAREIRLAAGAHGKPFLVGSAGLLEFNLAHSDDLAVYAFARRVAVGVDVERVSDAVAWEPLAEQFLSPDEQAAIRSLAPEQRTDAFFCCWTRKEAFVKALGEGLSQSPKTFTVTTDPAAPPRLVDVAPPVRLGDWSLVDLHPSQAQRARGRHACPAARGDVDLAIVSRSNPLWSFGDANASGLRPPPRSSHQLKPLGPASTPRQDLFAHGRGAARRSRAAM